MARLLRDFGGRRKRETIHYGPDVPYGRESMARKLIRRYLPGLSRIRQHRPLRVLDRFLHDPNIWHLNRYSASGAFAVGLFIAFMPIPFQMVSAAALAIILRLNLPLAVVTVWVTNPFTMPPLFYFCYKVGAWIMGSVDQELAFAWSWEWFRQGLAKVWEPFLLGCSVVGSLAALAGYFSVRALWRWHVITQWEKRKRLRALLAKRAVRATRN
ncbi:MAG: DUF2062 domain-containing protein [Acidiferrobacterales bacterium]|nr:DUF2062 domain-containing protein [Acidiferrobacterales bacterium]